MPTTLSSCVMKARLSILAMALRDAAHVTFARPKPSEHGEWATGRAGEEPKGRPFVSIVAELQSAEVAAQVKGTDGQNLEMGPDRCGRANALTCPKASASMRRKDVQPEPQQKYC